MLHGGVRHLAGDAVDHANRCEDFRELFGALGHGAYVNAGEGLALLAQDADDVAGGAGTQGDQDEFDGAVGRLLVPASTTRA